MPTALWTNCGERFTPVENPVDDGTLVVDDGTGRVERHRVPAHRPAAVAVPAVGAAGRLTGPGRQHLMSDMPVRHIYDSQAYRLSRHVRRTGVTQRAGRTRPNRAQRFQSCC